MNKQAVKLDATAVDQVALAVSEMPSKDQEELRDIVQDPRGHHERLGSSLKGLSEICDDLPKVRNALKGHVFDIFKDDAKAHMQAVDAIFSKTMQFCHLLIKTVNPDVKAMVKSYQKCLDSYETMCEQCHGRVGKAAGGSSILQSYMIAREQVKKAELKAEKLQQPLADASQMALDLLKEISAEKTSIEQERNRVKTNFQHCKDVASRCAPKVKETFMSFLWKSTKAAALTALAAGAVAVTVGVAAVAAAPVLAGGVVAAGVLCVTGSAVAAVGRTVCQYRSEKANYKAAMEQHEKVINGMENLVTGYTQLQGKVAEAKAAGDFLVFKLNMLGIDIEDTDESLKIGEQESTHLVSIKAGISSWWSDPSTMAMVACLMLAFSSLVLHLGASPGTLFGIICFTMFIVLLVDRVVQPLIICKQQDEEQKAELQLINRLKGHLARENNENGWQDQLKSKRAVLASVEVANQDLFDKACEVYRQLTVDMLVAS